MCTTHVGWMSVIVKSNFYIAIAQKRVLCVSKQMSQLPCGSKWGFTLLKRLHQTDRSCDGEFQ